MISDFLSIDIKTVFKFKNYSIIWMSNLDTLMLLFKNLNPHKIEKMSYQYNLII